MKSLLNSVKYIIGEKVPKDYKPQLGDRISFYGGSGRIWVIEDKVEDRLDAYYVRLYKTNSERLKQPFNDAVLNITYWRGTVNDIYS